MSMYVGVIIANCLSSFSRALILYAKYKFLYVKHILK